MTLSPTFRLIGLAGLLCALATTTHAGGLVEIDFDIGDFGNPTLIDNPYWPLAPGTSFVYVAEEDDDECVITDFAVTPMVKNDFGGDYAGIAARVIAETEWLDEDCDGTRDLLLEDTADWYGQDDAGNIWYFGEDTTAFEYDDDGNLIDASDEGAWEAGVDGAEAGIIMLATPRPGLFYRQEFFEDEAEDWGKVLRTNARVSIDPGEFEGCLVTKEWTPLERGAVEHKFYCPGVGLVLVHELGGGPTVVVEPVEIALP